MSDQEEYDRIVRRDLVNDLRSLRSRADALAAALEGLVLVHWRADGSEDCWCSASCMPEDGGDDRVHEDQCNAARAALAAYRLSREESRG